MCKTTKGDDVKKYGSNRKGGIRLIHGIYFLNAVTSNKSGPYPKFLPVVIFFWFLFHAHLLKFWIFLWFSMILFYADFLQFCPFTINVLLTFYFLNVINHSCKHVTFKACSFDDTKTNLLMDLHLHLHSTKCKH